MALPSENPVLAANLQLILSRAPGSDYATEALRKALLAVAAIHQSYLLSRNGTSPEAEEAMFLANGFRSESKQLLSESFNTQEGTQSDASLAASVSISLLDILSGGYNWEANLNIAKSLINMRGGPGVLLARSMKTKSGSINGVARARLFVEIVSLYDIFGCLATGQVPTLLSPQIHSWWLESANEEDTQSHVEKCFGISRTFVPIFVRVTSLLAHALAYRSNGIELSSEPALLHDAQNLYHELETWSSPGSLPKRIQAGNCVYKNTAQIAILREVIGLPFNHEVVQNHVEVVLTLCLECGTQKTSVDLNWPVIIAASQVSGAGRARVLEIFQCFQVQCCYEIETTQQIVTQVWQRLDAGQPGADWRSVMQDLDLNVLIL